MKIRLVGTIMCVMVIAIISSGCLTTTQKGTAIGTGAGAALGTGFGALAGSASTGALIGAGVGAVSGALAGDYMDRKREETEYAQLQRQLHMERQSRSGQGKNYIDGHYEYVKKRKWVNTSKKERVWVAERYEGDRRVEGHYQERPVPSGHWQEYEEKTWVSAHYE